MLEPDRPHIIGGMFGCEEPLNPASTAPPFVTDSALYLANARSGFAVLTGMLSPGRIWMPSYFCNHILGVMQRGAIDVRLYEVNYDLALSSLDWLSAVKAGDLVVLVDYFGFPADQLCKKRIREQGALILEDASQAMLTRTVGRLADFVLFSPRKFLGIPDGGILVFNTQHFENRPQLEQPPAAWWLKALSASLLRREFDRHGGSRRWFELFKEAESEGPVGLYAMSELSRTLIMNSIDYGVLAEKRIRNYQQLAAGLGKLAMFPALPLGVVPLGFPIRVRQRDRLLQALISHAIYPPVHWPIHGVVPETFMDSHRLSAEIMTLPCDQRYGQADMEKIIAVVKQQLSH